MKVIYMNKRGGKLEVCREPEEVSDRRSYGPEPSMYVDSRRSPRNPDHRYRSSIMYYSSDMILQLEISKRIRAPWIDRDKADKR